MKDYTTPNGLTFTPTEQCILHALGRYHAKTQNLQDPSDDGSVAAVVARWLCAPSHDLGPTVRYLQSHEDLRLEDVVYSLGDFKDFDEWIDYVEGLELRKERRFCRFICIALCKMYIPV